MHAKDELYHYGVLGMKWGVRKKRQKSDDAREASRLRKKRVSELSNAELRKLNDRTQLEQNYKRLHPNAVRKGIKAISATAGVMGTTMTLYNNSDKIVTLGKKVGGKVVDAVGDMIMNDLKKGFV